MTLPEALDLHEGDLVCHPARLDYRPDGTPVRAPMRVSKVWVNARRTIVLIRAAAVGGDQWLDATAYDLPPSGLVFDRVSKSWLTASEKRRLSAERRAATAALELP